MKELKEEGRERDVISEPMETADQTAPYSCPKMWLYWQDYSRPRAV